MYGAILGDIIGSPFEFDRGDKSKNFELFTRGCGFTDDSVMTIAVAAYSARTAHPFRRNGAPFRFKLSKAQLVD